MVFGTKTKNDKSSLGLRVNQVMFSPFEEDSEGKQGTRILGHSTVTDGRKSGNEWNILWTIHIHVCIIVYIYNIYI